MQRLCIYDQVVGPLGFLDQGVSAREEEQMAVMAHQAICVEAVENATIVQEQGPDEPGFKKYDQARVKQMMSRTIHLWSSISRIAASVHSKNMRVPSRLLSFTQEWNYCVVKITIR